MRQLIILLSLASGMALGTVSPAGAQVSIGIGIGTPNQNIGVNYPVYPRFEQVPGYPVYYAPQVNSNYFFYDGLYWVYANDNWYASSWYNGPWGLVSPMVVPVYVLRVPVRYYREPPVYFRGWRQDGPPRWDEHWGDDWRRQRSGWDQWNRSSVPAPAPLPVYQQQYSGGRYPSLEQQRMITRQNYHYQPHESVVQQHYQRYLAPTAPAIAQHNGSGDQHPQQSAQDRSSTPQDENSPKPHQHPATPPSQHRPPPAAGDHNGNVGDSSLNAPPTNQSQQQQSFGQHEGTPGQPESAGRERQEQHHQQPSAGEDHGPPGQGANAPKPPKQDQAREDSGEGAREKESPHDNR